MLSTFFLMQGAVIGAHGVLVGRNGRIRLVEMDREQKQEVLNMVFVMVIKMRLGNVTSLNNVLLVSSYKLLRYIDVNCKHNKKMYALHCEYS